MATNRQIAIIHTLAGRAGLEGDTYKDFLKRETGNDSSKQCTASEAGRVIDKLRDLAGQSGGAKGAVAGLATPVGAKLRALWIAGYNLGIVRVRDDKAMLNFLQRQTGVSHIRFLRDPGAATKAIEAMKAWLAREAKVAWPTDAEVVAGDGAVAAKRAVINAQWVRLIEIGAVKPYVAHMPMADLDQYAFKVANRQGWCFFEPRHYDDVQAALGRKLRAALANRV
jgi:hypothetical protein